MRIPVDVFSPLDQSRRCLDIWLKEEGRSLPPRMKARAAALMARYFHNEDNVSDQLMMSFLRHYSGFGEVDMDDPQCLRAELKSVLDRAAVEPSARAPRQLRVMVGVSILSVVMALAVMGWIVAHKTITLEQQKRLREEVARVSAAQGMSSASIWADIKAAAEVRRYQDIPWWSYDGIMERLHKQE